MSIVKKNSELKAWEILSSNQILDKSPWFTIHKESVLLPDGIVIDDYYTIAHRDYVEIFALTDDLKVISIWHYKHGPKKVTLGLPAGYLNDNEEAGNAAKREFFEETGYQASHWEKLGEFSNDGNRGYGKVHVYFATGLEKIAEADADDLEDYYIEEIDTTDLKNYFEHGRVATIGAALSICMGLNKMNI